VVSDESTPVTPTCSLTRLWAQAFDEDPAAAELAPLHVTRVKGVLRFDSRKPDCPNMRELVLRGLLVEGHAGYALTAKGSTRHEELLREFYRGRDLAGVETQYTVFAKANPLVEDACVTWQLSPRDSNAARAAHHALADLLDSVRPALKAMGEAVTHLDCYPDRLDDALRAVDSGDTRCLTSPLVDSFHQVWSELHQDLLITLGRERDPDRF
jgi:hypothetical protein